MKSNETDFSKMLGDTESTFPQWKSSFVIQRGPLKGTVQSWQVSFRSTRSGLCLVGLLWIGLKNNQIMLLGETLLQSKVSVKRPLIESELLQQTLIHLTYNISGGS